MSLNVDVAIVGAGPTGLCLAKSLADSGLSILLIERAEEASLSNPAFDGRQIALSHDSARLMQELSLWEHINPHDISQLRNARVFNGSSLLSLDIDHRFINQNELGYLVANHLIRKAAYDVATASKSIQLKTEAQIASIITGTHDVKVTLTSGEVIQTKLLVGADSRFSETRRAMGIAADMHDFGKTMMVCEIEHDLAHQHTAWEWFDYGQTLALLPMNGLKSSVVITLPPREISSLICMPEADFNHEISERFKHRLGAMRLASTRHAYPLVTVFAKRLINQRFALVGDAAVGMHPVTAHGFNFGLKGITTLSAEIKAAQVAGKDIADYSLLLRYEKAHRRHTKPLFIATHAIAKLYNNDGMPARLLRTGAIQIASRITPFRHAIAGLIA